MLTDSDLSRNSIHLVHDEAKDKDFELELSWIAPASDWKHVSVPKAIADAAETKAKEYVLPDSSNPPGSRSRLSPRVQDLGSGQRDGRVDDEMLF